jgi:hypothetical protein
LDIQPSFILSHNSVFLDIQASFILCHNSVFLDILPLISALLSVAKNISPLR